LTPSSAHAACRPALVVHKTPSQSSSFISLAGRKLCKSLPAERPTLDCGPLGQRRWQKTTPIDSEHDFLCRRPPATTSRRRRGEPQMRLSVSCGARQSAPRSGAGATSSWLVPPTANLGGLIAFGGGRLATNISGRTRPCSRSSFRADRPADEDDRGLGFRFAKGSCGPGRRDCRLQITWMAGFQRQSRSCASAKFIQIERAHFVSRNRRRQPRGKSVSRSLRLATELALLVVVVVRRRRWPEKQMKMSLRRMRVTGANSRREAVGGARNASLGSSCTTPA
jgi:hypothetical protein